MDDVVCQWIWSERSTFIINTFQRSSSQFQVTVPFTNWKVLNTFRRINGFLISWGRVRILNFDVFHETLCAVILVWKRNNRFLLWRTWWTDLHRVGSLDRIRLIAALTLLPTCRTFIFCIFLKAYQKWLEPFYQCIILK